MILTKSSHTVYVTRPRIYSIETLDRIPNLLGEKRIYRALGASELEAEESLINSMRNDVVAGKLILRDRVVEL